MPIPLGVLAVAGAGGGPTLANSYELIQTVEASGNPSIFSVEFTSIPQTYRHLQIRHSFRSGQGGAAITFRMTFNGETTGTNYNSHFFGGDGTNVVRDVNTNSSYINAGWTGGSSAGNSHGSGIIDILDYRGNKNKTVRCLGGIDTSSGSYVGLIGSMWANTSAITSIRFSTITVNELLFANFLGTHKISLYGIRG
jgi:hypothetical protein